MTSSSMSSVLDRFRGLMVGLAVGDCLGRPVEGLFRVPDAYLAEMVVDPPPLLYSDDTAMAMVVAESLLAQNGFSGEDMAQRFANLHQEDPNRGYGRNIVEVFAAVLAGVPWDQAARRQFGGEGSYGNGGAMRVSPVALWAYPSFEIAVTLARQTAQVTHTHPVGVEGAVLQAIAALHSVREDFDEGALLAELARVAETEEFKAKLDKLPGCLDGDDDERARRQLGNGVGAHESVITALYCFLLSSGFSDAVVRAVRIGGDTDTIAAMAGSLAGARHGLQAIPGTWRDVEASDQLLELADAMASRL